MSTTSAPPLALVAPSTTEQGAATVVRERAEVHRAILDLYRSHHADLVRLARLLAPEDGTAEDLVQESFVRLYKRWRRIDDPERIPAYLRSTLFNLARGRGRRLTVARRKGPDEAPPPASAEDGAMIEVRRDAVIDALRTLPGRQRECVVLRHYEGLGESAIAEALGISIGSVRTHTARANAALAARLGGHA